MDTKEIEVEMNESAGMTESGGHSTLNEVKDTGLTGSAVMNDSGLEMTPIVTNESNLTESVIISNAEAKSTPVTTKIKEKEWSMTDMMNFMRTMLDDIKHNMNVKFESNFTEQSVKFNELSSNINEVNTRFDAVKSDIIIEIDESCSTIIKQMQDEVNEIRKRKENKRDTGKWSENNNSCLLYTSRCV